jgi:ATP-dependent Clp protease protease subunit
VYQIFGVINLIEASKTPVHTICTGVAMSCGFLLLIHGHRRFCYKHSTPLYHQVSSWSTGTLKEITEKMTETTRLQKVIEDMTVAKTKITKARLKEVYDKQIDWYMTSSEAKKLGVIDEIL